MLRIRVAERDGCATIGIVRLVTETRMLDGLCGWLLVAGLASCTSVGTGNHAGECPECPQMVIVPPGTAIVGAARGDRFANADEPERTVRIDEAFAVSRHEVTRAQYEAFVAATRRAVGGDCLTDRNKRGEWVVDANTTFRDPGFAQADDHPVACVSWDDARAYVDWLNTRIDGGGYRLPTEVEWEYVARGGATRNEVYPWGDDPAPGCAYANGFDATAVSHYARMDTSAYEQYDPMPCSDALLNTAPVGSLAPNAFGVYDMIGNVSEWLGDCSDASCARRVAKGGSWGTLAHNLRTAERFPYAAGHRDDSIGIRVARTLHER